MLTCAENELMCRVGPGTGMAAALRRYWLPAPSSAKLPKSGADPLHVELLGEHWFHNTEGRLHR
jgi:phthalate 4,5-dioxygenase